MNRNTIIGLAHVVFAAALVGVISSSAGDVASRFVGKAVWYLPYAALVGGFRYFARAF